MVEIIVGVVLSFITSLAKSFGIRPKIAVVGVLIIASILFQAFKTFMPQEFQTSIVDFFMQTAGVMILFYNFVWEKYEKKIDEIE